MRGLRLLPALALLSACASAMESSKSEDHARRTIPVPICLKPLERHAASGVVSSLKPEDYWSMVLPGFDAGTSSVSRDRADCAGRNWALSRALRDAEGSRSGPISVKADAAVVTPGPDGLKVVWLRTHRFVNAEAGGPIALLRPREGYAEVYAIGVHRGSADKSRFAVERMGPHVLVTATDDGCAGVQPNQGCETTLDVYLMRAGRLSPAASFPLDRIHYGPAPGSGSSAQYRLVATPVFQDDSIRVAEQVVVKDSTQGEVRKADLERIYRLEARGQLVPSSESLWGQVMGEAAQAVPAPQPPPPAAPNKKK